MIMISRSVAAVSLHGGRRRVGQGHGVGFSDNRAKRSSVPVDNIIDIGHRYRVIPVYRTITTE